MWIHIDFIANYKVRVLDLHTYDNVYIANLKAAKIYFILFWLDRDLYRASPTELRRFGFGGLVI